MAATSALLSAACQPAAPPASTPLAATSRGTGAASVFPTYTPTQGGPPADFSSNGPLYEEGFTDYPASRFKAWTKNPPGTGGDVQALVVVMRPAVRPVARADERVNPWQLLGEHGADASAASRHPGAGGLDARRCRRNCHDRILIPCACCSSAND